MKWKIVFAILFFCSVAVLVFYSRMPLIQYTVTATETAHQLDKDGYPTGESYSKRPSSIVHIDNFGAIGGAIGFGIIAAGALMGFALTLGERINNKK
jgi:hypothetical protein